MKKILYDFLAKQNRFVFTSTWNFIGLFLNFPSIGIERNLFFVKGKNKFYYLFPHRTKLYKRSIEDRFESLMKTYNLENIKFSSNDLIIDCGANIGEFSIAMVNNFNCRVLAFEPIDKDYECLKRNINEWGFEKKIQLFKIGLSNFTGIQKFYVDSENAASSFVGNESKIESIQIQAVKLHDFIKKEKLKTIKLLKIEAEGFEPQILEGLKSSSKLCKYISVKMDEKNQHGLSNIEIIIDWFYKNNFRLLKFSTNKKSAIFINNGFK